MSFNSTTVVVAVILAVPFVGLFIESLLRKLRLRGYGGIAREIGVMARALHGELDRDSGDVLVRGRINSSPVLVRISNSEQRPGLNIQVPAGRNISLYCAPRERESDAGRAPLSVADASFNAHFRLTSDHPGMAQVLFCTPDIVAEIQKVCVNAGSFLTLEEQRLEMTEAVIPEAELAHRVLECGRALVTIAAASRHMPGAQADRVPAVPRQWNWFRTLYIGLPVLLLTSLLVVARLRQKPAEEPTTAHATAGIPRDQAAQAPQIQEWRLAQTGDFDAEAVAWLRQQGYTASGSLQGAFAGKEQTDVAYVMKHTPGTPGDPSRLLVFLEGQLRFDANLPEIAIAARVPRNRLASIDWRGRAPSGPANGDGILIVQKYRDPSSAIVLFQSGVQLLTGRPKDFHSISLQP